MPLIGDWINSHQGLVLMQDHAPGHAAAATIQDFQARRVEIMDWPTFSPDLNLIENVWNKMKDFMDSLRSDVVSGKGEKHFDTIPGEQTRFRAAESSNVI